MSISEQTAQALIERIAAMEAEQKRLTSQLGLYTSAHSDKHARSSRQPVPETHFRKPNSPTSSSPSLGQPIDLTSGSSGYSRPPVPTYPRHAISRGLSYSSRSDCDRSGSVEIQADSRSSAASTSSHQRPPHSRPQYQPPGRSFSTSQLQGYGSGWNADPGQMSVVGGKPGPPHKKRTAPPEKVVLNDYVRFGHYKRVVFVPSSSVILEKVDISNGGAECLYDLCERLNYVKHPLVLKTDTAEAVISTLTKTFQGVADIQSAGYLFGWATLSRNGNYLVDKGSAATLPGSNLFQIYDKADQAFIFPLGPDLYRDFLEDLEKAMEEQLENPVHSDMKPNIVIKKEKRPQSSRSTPQPIKQKGKVIDITTPGSVHSSPKKKRKLSVPIRSVSPLPSSTVGKSPRTSKTSEAAHLYGEQVAAEDLAKQIAKQKQKEERQLLKVSMALPVQEQELLPAPSTADDEPVPSAPDRLKRAAAAKRRLRPRRTSRDRPEAEKLL